MHKQRPASIAAEPSQACAHFFDATPLTIFTELFQNALASNARNIDVQLNGSSNSKHCLIAVKDDGDGIPDPETILRPNPAPIDPATDLPAPTGLACLADIGCTILSLHDSIRWQCTLQPSHFADGQPAFLRDPHADALSTPTGTRVIFSLPISNHCAALAVDRCAIHLPVPVQLCLTRLSHSQHCVQRPFIKAFDGHIATIDGIRFSVFILPYSRLPDPDLCIRGRTINARLPKPSDAAGRRWNVRAEIDRLDGLRLTFPQNDALIENEAAEKLRHNATLAIYGAMSRLPDPTPTHHQYTQARRLGIANLRQPDPALVPWTARPLYDLMYDTRENAPQPLPPDAVVIDEFLTSADEQNLHRAIRFTANSSNGQHQPLGPLFRGNPHYPIFRILGIRLARHPAPGRPHPPPIPAATPGRQPYIHPPVHRPRLPRRRHGLVPGPIPIHHHRAQQTHAPRHRPHRRGSLVPPRQRPRSPA